MLTGSQLTIGLSAVATMLGCSGGSGRSNSSVSQSAELSNLPIVPALALSMYIDAGPNDSGAAHPGLEDPTEVAAVRSIALATAAGAGVPSPTKIQVVAAADHKAAEFALCGAIVNDHAPVYVIKMTGGVFTGLQHPRQAPIPQGSVLTLTMESATHRITDIGLVNVEPDLSAIDSHVVDL